MIHTRNVTVSVLDVVVDGVVELPFRIGLTDGFVACPPIGVIGRLRADGTGIVYISHRLEEVFALADRITVLKDGGRVKTLTDRFPIYQG